MESPESVLRDAISLEAAGDLFGAESLLKRACGIWKSEPEFKLRHADILVKLGQAKRALKRFREVMKSHPQRVEAPSGAAKAAFGLQRYKLAEKIYIRAMAIGLDGDEAALGIAACQLARGSHEVAWHTALARFEKGQRSHKGLHQLLTEIAPKLGRVPPTLEIYDSIYGGGEMITDGAATSEILKDAQYEADPMVSAQPDSMEALAGIAAHELRSDVEDDTLNLLTASEESQTSRRDVEIDLSSIDTLSKSNDLSSKESSDDILDFDL
jgi:tetratricopeptide (TPR) repeat protein